MKTFRCDKSLQNARPTICQYSCRIRAEIAWTYRLHCDTIGRIAFEKLIISLHGRDVRPYTVKSPGEICALLSNNYDDTAIHAGIL